MIKGNAAWLLLLCMMVLACRHREPPFTVYRNVAYGPDATFQSMDVFLPEKRNVNTTPVIVVIHGGAWWYGDKEGMNKLDFDTFFTANGCAVVNMNYRMVGSCKYPAELDDIGLVMKYVKGKAAEWKINADKVCMLGMSSGAHLGMLYAYTRNADKRIKAVVDFFGPADLTDSTIACKTLGANVTNLLGPLDSNRQRWHDASPVFFTKNAVPTVIFQGTADTAVYFVQSQKLDDSLRANGIADTFYTWHGGVHGWYADRWRGCRESAMAWVRKYLR